MTPYMYVLDITLQFMYAKYDIYLDVSLSMYIEQSLVMMISVYNEH